MTRASALNSLKGLSDSAPNLLENSQTLSRFYLFKATDLRRLSGSFGLLFALIFGVYYSCIFFIPGGDGVGGGEKLKKPMARASGIKAE